MTQYTQFTAIVPAQYAELYRQSAASVHSAAQGMFVTPLYSGSEVSHYISTGKIDAVFETVVTDPAAFADAVGVPLEQAQGLKAGFTYIAVGDFDGEQSLLHNLEAIELLGLSRTPEAGDE